MSNPLAPDWLARPDDANRVDAHLWPDDTHRDDLGELVFGSVSASSLVQQFGTPLYVLDLDTVTRRARWFHEVMADALERSGRTLKIYYATKALVSADLIRSLHTLGLGFDVSSRGEWEWARRAGVPASDIEYQGNNKSLAELRAAIQDGVGSIVIDSAQEVSRIAAIASELGVVQEVLIRVNTGVHAGTHEYLATAREDQKFGIARADIGDLADQISRQPTLRLVGLHSHIGSQIVAPDGFVEATKRVLEIYGELASDHPLTTINIGGGFGIAYTPGDAPADVPGIARAIGEEIDAFCARTGVSIDRVACEPGRLLVGPAGVTLYEVGTTKSVAVDTDHGVAHRLYVSVDGGMSDNLRAALYGANYTVRLASRRSEADSVLVRVVGSHCESGDIVVHADYLPGDVTPGDLLAVAATGAYCHSLSSNYNAVGRPALVVTEGGEARVSLRAETIEDVLGRDIGLALGGQSEPRPGETS